jgi:hypothetical protein
MANLACAHHPDRHAHALCMSCHKGVCHECATTWDGINYCTRCLAEQRRSAAPRASWPGIVLVALLAAALLSVVPPLMVWSGVNALDLWR